MAFAEEDNTKKVSTEIVKCESCGANMVFNPDLQMLYCPHCESKQEIKSSGHAKELNLSGAFSKDGDWRDEGALSFRCSNCGAQVVLSKGETAKSCPFCGTAHVEQTSDLLGLKPNAVLPFKFGIEKAIEISKNWAKRKLFAPKKFKKNLDTNSVNGVYAPCFTFDSNTTSHYQGRIGRTEVIVVGSGKDRRTKTVVHWRNVNGIYYDKFDDILVTAGEKFNQSRLNKLSPYDTNASEEYQKKYLFGFMAYHYDRDITSCWGQAKDVMDGVIRNKILRQYVGYDRVDYLNVSTVHEGATYKYVMLPVYIGNFNYNKRLYNFYVNGTTGKTTGKTPVSPLKILLTVGISIAVCVGVALLCRFLG